MTEHLARAVASEDQRGERQILLPAAHHRIAESGVAVERFGLVLEKLQLRRTGRAETVARIDERREAFHGQYLPISGRHVVEFVRRHHARIGDGESVVVAQLLAVTEPRYWNGPRATVPRLSMRARASTGLYVASTSSVAALGFVSEALRLAENLRPGRSPASTRQRSMVRTFAGRAAIIFAS